MCGRYAVLNRILSINNTIYIYPILSYIYIYTVYIYPVYHDISYIITVTRIYNYIYMSMV